MEMFAAIDHIGFVGRKALDLVVDFGGREAHHPEWPAWQRDRLHRTDDTPVHHSD